MQLQKLRQTVYVEFRDIIRWHRLGRWATAVLPIDTCHRSRVRILRRFGWNLGHGTVLAATPRLLGSGDLHRRLTIGRSVYINVGATFEVGAEIDIGDHVHIGQGVSLLTTTHEVGPAVCRAGGMFRSPITVGAGTWISTGATVLAGVTIGEGAIIAAKCLVRNDVPDNCVFGGVPGRVIRFLDDELQPAAPTHLVDVERHDTPDLHPHLTNGSISPRRNSPESLDDKSVLVTSEGNGIRRDGWQPFAAARSST